MVIIGWYLLLLAVGVSGQELYYQDSPLAMCNLSRYRNMLVRIPNEGCQRFVFCSEAGTAFGPIRCGDGTLFNSEKQYCDHPWNVQCDDGAPKCVNEAVKGDCNKFDICDGRSEKVRVQCGLTTFFSNKRGVCVRFEDLDDDEQDYCRQ